MRRLLTTHLLHAVSLAGVLLAGSPATAQMMSGDGDAVEQAVEQAMEQAVEQEVALAFDEGRALTAD